MKIVIFFSFSPLHTTVVSTTYEYFEACIFGCISVKKCRISNMGSLAIEISSEKALELQLIYEIHHRMIFSKFGWCILRSNLYIIKHFEKFHLILTCHLSRKW